MQSSFNYSTDSLSSRSSPFRSKLVRVNTSCVSLPLCSSVPSMHRNQLCTGSSCGSLLSIYDDQSISSVEADISSDMDSVSLAPRRESDGDHDYLTCYHWYVGKLSRLEAEQCLEGLRDGAYLIRRTEGKSLEYTHAIAVRWKEQPFHLRIYKKERMFSVANFRTKKFPTIEDLVAHFQRNSLSSNFPAITTTLLYPYHEEIAKFEAIIAPESFDNHLLGFTTDENSGLDGICCIDTSVQLIEQEWYHGKLSRDKAEGILRNQPDFGFLLRDSESVPGGYSLSIKDETCAGFIHLRISDHRGMYVLGQYSKPFPTLTAMIKYYCDNALNIKGIPHRSLKYPVSR